MSTVIEMLPESFNQLRKVLATEHEDLWAKVGWNMAYDPSAFIMLMNDELDCVCDSRQGIEAVCTIYLDRLKLRKGRPATKSLELIVAEREGKFGTAAIFGNDDDYGAAADKQAWERKKGLRD
jgi:hypothetical protein